MGELPILSKVLIIDGVSVELYSRDGINWATDSELLTTLEKASNLSKPDSPFWELPRKIKTQGAKDG